MGGGSQTRRQLRRSSRGRRRAPSSSSSGTEEGRPHRKKSRALNNGTAQRGSSTSSTTSSGTTSASSNSKQPSTEGGDKEEWLRMFRQLCDFRAKTGTCAVKKFQNPELSEWCRIQRLKLPNYAKRKGAIFKDEHEQIAMLNSVGFAWSHRQGIYDFMVHLLEEFKKEHGHCLVPQHHIVVIERDELLLGRWCDTQRRQYKLFQDGKRSEMTPERIARLEAIGFDFGSRKPDRKAQLEMHIALVLEYKKEHGNCQVPSSYITPSGVRLGGWVAEQRIHFDRFHSGNHAKITQERINKLDTIDFWQGERKELVLNPGWFAMVEALRQFTYSHGHFDVPSDFVAPGGADMAKWIDEQRSEYRYYQEGKRSNLSPEKIDKLNEIDFDWGTSSALDVVHNIRPVQVKNNLNRSAATTKTSSKPEVQSLSQQKHINAETELNKTNSVPKLQSLSNHQQINAETKPKKKDIEPKGQSLSKQQRKKAGTTHAASLPSSESLEPPAGDERIWRKFYSAMQVYQKKHGHCRVNKMSMESGLQLWTLAEDQRAQYHRFLDGKTTTMTVERIEKLMALGFDWGSYDDADDGDKSEIEIVDI